MRCTIQVVIETESGTHAQDIVHIERETTKLESIGLTLAEAKALVRDLQQMFVQRQVADYLTRHQQCAACGQPLRHKGSHGMAFRTLFGNLKLSSPRLFHCPCQPHATRTFSPLSEQLGDHTAPERLYLETKWGALLSFELARKLLGDVLPLDAQLNAASLRNHLQQVAQRTEAELGAERLSFIDGCPHEWAALPRPAPPLTVGIDGGYVRDWTHKQTHFEVIVGKSMSEEGPNKRFGFVQTYDDKPKRRLFEMLHSQGLAMNQQITFLSDGGETVRDLQLYLNPEAEHYLDWFHVTMRLTVMGQYAKGLPAQPGKDGLVYRAEVEKELKRIKWYLWHGNVVRALDRIEGLACLLEEDEHLPASGKKLATTVEEFHTYIQANAAFIPNYGERWRHGDSIASGFVESTVNEVVSKRMVKKQQMQWTRRGAHLLLQVRTKVLNEELDQTFQRWYPGFRHATDQLPKAA